jgi:hypothetical protein
MKVAIRLVLACAVVGWAAQAAQAGNPVVDGGFESPLVPSGSYTLFTLGQTFSNWDVVGKQGNVAIVSGTFAQNGFSFPAHSGGQWLDLTGTSDTPTGVKQTVVTTPHHVYHLNFWVGNVYDPGGIFGTSSRIHAYVDGLLLATALNAAGKGTHTLVWHRFSVNFTAKTAETAITFLNDDRVNDTLNALDDVALVPFP